MSAASAPRPTPVSATSAPAGPRLLDARQLRKAFGSVVALDGLDFRVNANEIVGIIGPNGSGKTTLFNLLSGFLQSSGGSITLRGQDITRLPAHRRARMGLVRTFQETMVFPGLSVRENLETALRAVRRHESGEPRTPEDLVSYVRLSHVIDQLAADLSWGQTRLLGIAIALTTKPALLLLDEPFAGLSPAAAEEVGSIVLQLKSDGLSLCVIDHEMGFLLPICDRLVVLVNGATIADGVPADVIAREDVREAYLGI